MDSPAERRLGGAPALSRINKCPLATQYRSIVRCGEIAKGWRTTNDPVAEIGKNCSHLGRMLDFVWNLRGSVALGTTDTDEAVFDRLERLLEKQRKKSHQRHPEYLAFDYPLFSDLFAPNWLAMIIYDRGRFWIEQRLDERRLRYELRSLHLLIFCMLAAALAFLFGLASSGLLVGLSMATGAFAWLYGMNILLALVRVPNAIHKAITT